ncbi:MAG: acetylornithine aminotransferase [Nitrospiraceae bacterium]|nr:acetylornithine aminotransferase [Nitrospiraceae bacterium]
MDGQLNSQCVADQFHQDPRVIQAKRLILDALSTHQHKLDGPRPSNSSLDTSYMALLGEAGKLRGRPLMLPYIGTGIGRGALVELGDGSVKYDFISGIGVHVLGHSHPAIVMAAIDAALSDTIMQGNLQQNSESVELARELCEVGNRNDGHFTHCFLATSGAMANENALKLVFQQKAPANRILAFRGGFAGRTLALSHITDRPEYRQGLPETVAVDYVPFFDSECPIKSTSEASQQLRYHLQKYPGEHAVMIFELIQGEGGVYPGNREFFIALMDILREHHVPIMIDEIQTFGRTTEPFAFQHFGLDEYVDVVTVGKLLQVCATLFSEPLNPSGPLLSQTFTGSTSAIFAARAILRELLSGDYFGEAGKILKFGNYFISRLTAIQQRHPEAIDGPFGFGGMIAFTPFGGNPQKAAQLVRALFEAGVLCFTGGNQPARIRFLVPYGAVRYEDIDAVTVIVEQTISRIVSLRGG